MENNIIEVEVNYQGDRYQIKCDPHTANIILNDQEQCDKFVEKLLESNKENENIWTSRIPTNVDIEATYAFISLRREMASKFDDKKTTKLLLWKEISEKLINMGYKIETGKIGAEKCRQKFYNLQKQYIAHVSHVNSTGQSKKDPPPFFGEMHDLLGDKDKVNPKGLQDSLENENANISESETSNTEENNMEAAGEIRNRFSKTLNSVRPRREDPVLELLKDQHKQELDERRQQFEVLKDLLQEQNDQRERMLNVFERMAESSKKRRLDTD